MLKNHNVLIIGGDTRYLEVINHLTKKNANVLLVGFDQLTFNHKSIVQLQLDKVEFHEVNAILLPVSGTDSSGKIIPYYSEKPISLVAEMIKQTPTNCVIYTGVSNSFLDNIAITSKREIHSLFARDDLAILNSIPTAEGALQLAMENTKVTIHSAKIIVFGFGRVGMTVARLFSAVGAHVHAYARNPAQIARIFEMGLTPINSESLDRKVPIIDIMINTIPHEIINKKVISATNQSTLIIDLASAPGGTDFEYAKKRGIKTIHALGLPGKVAPKSAGEMIANTLYTSLIGNIHN